MAIVENMLQNCDDFSNVIRKAIKLTDIKYRQSVAIAVIFSDIIIQIFVPVCKFIQIISIPSGVSLDAPMDLVFILDLN